MTIHKDLLGKQDVTFGTGQYERRGRGGFAILVDQINAGHIPIIDASERFTGTTVEAALGELLTADDLSDALVAQALDELIETLGQGVVLSGGLYEYVSNLVDACVDEALLTLYPLIDAAGGEVDVLSDTNIGVPDVAGGLSGGLYEFVTNIVEACTDEALQTLYPLTGSALGQPASGAPGLMGVSAVNIGVGFSRTLTIPAGYYGHLYNMSTGQNAGVDVILRLTTLDGASAVEIGYNLENGALRTGVLLKPRDILDLVGISSGGGGGSPAFVRVSISLIPSDLIESKGLKVVRAYGLTIPSATDTLIYTVPNGKVATFADHIGWFGIRASQGVTWTLNLNLAGDANDVALNGTTNIGNSRNLTNVFQNPEDSATAGSHRSKSILRGGDTVYLRQSSGSDATGVHYTFIIYEVNEEYPPV